MVKKVEDHRNLQVNFKKPTGYFLLKRNITYTETETETEYRDRI